MKKPILPKNVFPQSMLLAFRQCPKRLWLEINRPELRNHSTSASAIFHAGPTAEAIARRLYDPQNQGRLIAAGNHGWAAALKHTQAALASRDPVFGATMAASGALATTDVLLPAYRSGRKGWRIVKVKSSTRIEDHHRDDLAIQAFVVKKAKVPVRAVALAHIDDHWVYPGGEDYRGILVEHDLTAEAVSRGREVASWVKQSQAVANERIAPSIETGTHCNIPCACGFLEHCENLKPSEEYPAAHSAQTGTRVLQMPLASGTDDMREVPDESLDRMQRRIQEYTLADKTYFDARGAGAALRAHRLPVYFLHFKTLRFAVPIWKGTRPYQQIAFQFSVYRLGRNGKLVHRTFLDLSGQDPSKALAEALIVACGDHGTIFGYDTALEQAVILELAQRFPRMRRSLKRIHARIADLKTVVENHYYHPRQQGSWSIQAVLPTITPELNESAAPRAQETSETMAAYLEGTSPGTSDLDKSRIETRLLDSCRVDTYGLVRLWQFLSGSSDLPI